MDAPKPWDKLPKEKYLHWQWFLTYRDMYPKRSLARISEKVGKCQSVVDKTAAKYKWTERCKAWDREMATQLSRQMDAKAADLVESMRRRHIKMGMGMQHAATKELVAWCRKIEAAAREAREQAEAQGRDPGRSYHEPLLKITDLLRLVSEGTALERLNRGEPTEHTQVDTGFEGLETLTADELRTLRELKAKIKGQ